MHRVRADHVAVAAVLRDEPTSGLDAATSLVLLRVLSSLCATEQVRASLAAEAVIDLGEKTEKRWWKRRCLD